MVAPKADRSVANVPRIRSAYDGSRVAVRCICVEGEDRTRQEFKDECDINVLMARYEKTGVLPQGNAISEQYADVSAWDFADSMNKIAVVRGVFSQLDARTRARFENNPELMLEFVADPSNRAEAVKLGLMPEESVEHGRDESDAGTGGVGSAGEASKADGGPGPEAVGDDRAAVQRAATPRSAGVGADVVALDAV